MNVTIGQASVDKVLTAQCVPTNYYPKLQLYANWFLATYPFMWAGYDDIGAKGNGSDILEPYDEGGFLALQLAIDNFISLVHTMTHTTIHIYACTLYKII